MDRPKFLFILTPPYSGSTVLAKILNSSPRSMMLIPRGEGQWLIPSLCADDRWNPEKKVDWAVVREVWLKKYREVNDLVGTIDVIIEKSPPNLVRISQLLDAFPNSACMAFNRDPYAHVSSVLHRQHSPAALAAEDRSRTLEVLTEEWVVRSGLIKQAIEDRGLLNFTYEQFCANPRECVARVVEICPELVSVDHSCQVRVKDYPPQGVADQNPRQIALLSNDDINTITRVLDAEASGLLSYFGYSLREPAGGRIGDIHAKQNMPVADR